MTYITYDGIIYSLQKGGGISKYFAELIPRVADHVDVEVLAYGPGNFHLDAVRRKGVRITQVTERVLERLRSVPSRHTTAARVLHSTYYRTCRSSIPSVVTLHDFTAERFGRDIRSRVLAAQKRRAVEHASAVICVSQATAADLGEYMGPAALNKSRVIYHGISELYFDEQIHPGSGVSLPDWPYVMFVGNRKGYKNFDAAVQALDRSMELGAVIVGGEPLSADEEARIRRKVGRRYRVLQNVSEEGMVALYRGAFCLMYPSVHEGFGMPVLEAMASCCPVIGVRRSAVAEIAGSAAILVELGTTDEFRAALQSLESQHLRSNLVMAARARAREFSWDRCAAATVDTYRAVW